MRKFFLYILLIASSLFSDEAENEIYITSENDSLSLVEGVVNANNGKLVQVDRDIQIEGSDPLDLIRYYDGGHHFFGEYGYGIGLSLPTLLTFNPVMFGRNVTVNQRRGSDIHFNVKKQEGEKNLYRGKVSAEYTEMGYTNCCEALLRGSVSIHSMEVEGDDQQFVLKMGDGTVRTYIYFKSNGLAKKYRLVLEQLPNGNFRHYRYRKKDSLYLERIWTANKENTLILNWIDFSYYKKYVTAEASNGQSVRYELPTKKGTACQSLVFIPMKWAVLNAQILTQVSGDHIPTTQYKMLKKTKEQELIFSVEEVKKPDGRFLSVGYNSQGKVKRMKSSGNTRSLYNFDYHKHYTNVTDAKGNLKKYSFDSSRRLNELSETFRTQEYKWDSKGQLTSHTLKTPKGETLNTKTYSYDSQGNVIRTIVRGAMTQKGAEDEYQICYTYSKDGRNLLLSKKINDKKEILYTYEPESSLVASKTTLADQIVVEREFFQYDSNAILVRKIEESGTTRKITEIVPQLDPNLPGLTFPKVISEFYENPNAGIKTLLKRIERVYIQGDLLGEEKVYDADGVFRYALSYAYNEKRQLVRESDPLGVETHYTYDSNGNKICVERVGSGVVNRYIYDKGNRLKEQIEEHDDGKVLTTSYTYDIMGNQISLTDCFGQVTKFKYDSASRKIATIDPLGFSELIEYDAVGNITKITDKEGGTTSTLYNVNGDPLEIRYPDDSQERFNYTIQGHLIRKWERDGTRHSYQVDYQGRPLVIETFSSDGTFLKRIENIYEGPCLTHEIDGMGNITSYEYDSYGRKTAEIQEGKRVEYSYDSLGRLSKTLFSDKVDTNIYDNLNRLIEERVEDYSANIFKKTQFSYDVNSNCISERVYSDQNSYSETKTVYDSCQRPIFHIDALGHQTTYAYYYTDHLEKEAVDPLSKCVNEVYDPLNRVVSQEVTHSGVLLAKEDYDYSPNGHKIRQVNHVIESGKTLGSSLIEWVYDSMGNVLSQIEQGSKVTGYSYIRGRLHTTTKPNGVVLTQKYDSLGRVSSLTSSDGTIRYTYQYDRCDNLLKTIDLNTEHAIERRYDSHNRIIHEKQATGIEFDFLYDAQDRLTEMSWQDNTIIYEYSPTALNFASRYKGGQELYCYEQTVDWRGNVIAGILPNGTIIDYEWDPVGRCSTIQSKYFEQDLFYDSVGNLIATTFNDDYAAFDYDHLYQHTSESGLFSNHYTFDSLNNRRSKNDIPQDIDALNQLLSDSKHIYQYDLNGNRTSKGNKHYSYDALGRLISYSDENSHINYRYDPLGRCYEKKDLDTTIEYIHQFDTEIGAFENGKIKELRAIHGQFSSFAFELDRALYFPIRNHRGDTCLLLDRQGEPVSTYHYDAFGEFVHEGSIASPWLFSGQRYDSATALYTYAKRNYDPAIGRWLTPDPIGFADGPNLYAYVHNNPYRYFDPDGCTALEFAQGAAVTGGTVLGVGFATRGVIAGVSTLCPPLGAGLAIGATVYSAGSLIYDNWDSISHYASTYANKGFKGGNAELGTGLTNSFNDIMQASDYNKGCYFTSAISLITPGRKSTKPQTPKVAAPKSIVNRKLDLDALSKAGQVPDRAGLTRAGRALDKHGNRLKSPFPKATGSPASKNIQGQYHLDDILTDPLTKIKYNKSGSVQIYSGDGRGAYFNSDGIFRGFLDR